MQVCMLCVTVSVYAPTLPPQPAAEQVVSGLCSSSSPMSEAMKDCLQSQLPHLLTHCQFSTTQEAVVPEILVTSPMISEQSLRTDPQLSETIPQPIEMVPQPTETVQPLTGAFLKPTEMVQQETGTLSLTTTEDRHGRAEDE